MSELELADFRINFPEAYFPSCSGCSIALEPRLRRHVKPRGSFDAPIVIVGEAPGQMEEEMGTAFIGPAGQLLTKLVQEVGISEELLYITNTIKCRPTGNRDPSSDECKKCRALYLVPEILSYPRKLIIGIGNFGLFGVIPKGSPSGITTKAGIFRWNDEFNCYVLPVIHPAAVLRNPSNETLLRDALVKAKAFIDDGFQLPPQPAVTYKEIRDLDSLYIFIEEVTDSKRVIVDIETTGFAFHRDRIICMSFSTHSNSAWYLPMEEDGKWIWSRFDWDVIENELRKIFEDSTITKMGFNLKFDLEFLIYNFGWDVQGSLDDPMLMHHLVDENTPHGLKSIAGRFTSMGDYSRELEDAFTFVKRSRIPVEQKHYGQIPSTILKQYAMMDADATYRVYEYLLPLLQEVGLYQFYRRSIIPVMKVLMEMEMTGVRVDRERMAELEVEFAYKLDETQRLVNEAAGEDVNVKSTQQLQRLLFQNLRLPIIKRTDKGSPSTDEESLTDLFKRTKHPVLELILEFRKSFKLYGTYIVGLMNEIADDGRLHTSYLQSGTSTGRLSSSRPALQNVPRASTIKSLFVPTQDWYMLSADYGQHEVRVWANYSKDPKLIEALTTGDVHSNIGSILLNKPPEDISKEERVLIKACEFGLMYGMGTYTLASDVGISIEKAEEFYNLFFGMFPIATQWLLDQEKYAHEHGYVRNLFGRIRHLPEINSNDPLVVAAAERQSRNAVIQGAASDITNLALTRINKAFKSNGMRSRLLLQIHDEILSETPEDEVLDAKEIIESQMLAPIPGFDIPLSVEATIVKQWGGEGVELK